MTVLCSFLCAARTRFKCAHRQELEVVLCAARAASSARSAHRNRSVCVARTPPSTPRACSTHAPVLCVRARATHTQHTDIERVLPARGFKQGPTEQPRY